MQCTGSIVVIVKGSAIKASILETEGQQCDFLVILVIVHVRVSVECSRNNKQSLYSPHIAKQIAQGE